MRIFRSRPSGRVLLGAGLLVAVACSDMLVDPAAPGGPSLALQLGAEGGVDGLAKAFSKADHMRVVLTEGGITVKDVVLDFASEGEETRLRVPIEEGLVGKPLGLSLELLRGEAALFRGESSVVVQPGIATPAPVGLRPIPAAMVVPDSFPVLESLGDELRLLGAVVLATGDTVPGIALRWRALDSGPVEVSADGRALARQEGEARVQASAESFTAVTRLRVRQKPQQVEVQRPSSVLGIGGSETLEVTLRDARGNEISGRDATWTSSDPSVVSVDSTGRVQAVSVGTATITAAVEGASGSVEVTVGRPLPVMTDLQPREAAEGAAAVTLRVLGRAFDNTSVVLWDGAERPSSFVSSTELRAAIPASDLAVARTARVAVRTPAPGGGVSDALSFEVVAPTPAPVPVVHSLSPGRRTAGQGAFVMTITGRDFTENSLANWNGAVRPTVFVSSTELRVSVLASDVDEHGTARVFVSTPMPGGGVSGTLSFIIDSSARIALSPASVGFRAASGEPLPAAQAVEITNGGGETLSGLGATISYSGSVTGWLSASLSGTTAPAAVTLRPSTTTLPVGSYTAMLTVRSSLSGVPDQTATITYTVTRPLVVLSVSGSGYASGTVTSTPAGISCAIDAGSTSGTCSARVAEGTAVRLTAVPGTSSSFRGWSGACAGTTTCDLTPTASTSTSVRFESSVPPRVTVRAPESVTSTSAVLSGDVSTAVAEPIIGRVEVNPTASPSTVSRYCEGMLPAGTRELECSVSGLQAGIEYDYRLIVTGAGSGLVGSAAGKLMPPAPVPVIHTLSPARATEGGGAFTMTITGRDFTGSSVARWNGADRATTVVSATELRVAIPASDIASHGTAAVSVYTPAPGGGTSGTLSFTIDPAARIALSPASVAFRTIRPALPAAQTVSISNGGTGTLSGLSATITYSGSATGWLTAALSGTTAPATVTLQPNTTSIPDGTHTAVLTVRSSLPGVPEQTATISYTVDPALVSLTVTGSGYASGTVASTPAGISCSVSAGETSGACTGLFPEGSTVRLTATAGASSVFYYWTDACGAAESSTCDLALTASTSTGVRFESAVAPRVTARPAESVTPTSATLSGDITMAVAEPFTFHVEANPVASPASVARYCAGEMPAGTTRVSCSAAGLTAGTEYEFRVVVVGIGSGLSGSARGTFTTPDAPPVLSFVAHHTWLFSPPYVGMQVTWTNGTAPVTSYVLERRGPLDAGFVTVATLPADTLRYVDRPLSEGTVYHYRVSGCDESGCLASNEISQRTILLPPMELAARDSAEGARLSWTNHSEVADSVEITRRNHRTDETRTFRTGATGAGYFFDGTVPRGDTYTYTIRACRDSFGCSVSATVTIDLPVILGSAGPVREPESPGPVTALGAIPRSAIGAGQVRPL